MNDLRKDVLEFLKDHRDTKWYKNTGYLETKCPICDANSKKRHLSIKLIDNQPIAYKCFRASCNAGGILNRKFAKTLGLPEDLCQALEDESLKYHNYSTTPKYYSRKGDFLLGVIDTAVNEYFRDRTGKDIFEVQEKLRITTNITNWQKINNIRIKQLYPLVLWEERGDKFIYFFNSAYSTVHYRQINGDKRGRVTLVTGSTKEPIRHKPYFIEDNINKFDDENSVLVLAEGPFDIINTYLYLNPEPHGMYIAVGGMANMKSIIMEYTKYHYRAKVYIMSDDDVDISWYKRYLLPRIDQRISSLEIIYNTKAKDVGNIEDGIELKRTILKLFDPEIEKEYNGDD